MVFQTILRKKNRFESVKRTFLLAVSERETETTVSEELCVGDCGMQRAVEEVKRKVVLGEEEKGVGR